MAKWYGIVGYINTVETEPGVWKPIPIERSYYGDIERNTSKWTTTNKVNSDVDVSNRISIVADPFAYQNFHTIRYVEFMGAVWDVTSVEVQQPRLILNIGGVYNGERAQA